MSAPSGSPSATGSAGTTVEVPPARRWASLAVLSASLLVVTMDLTILNVALPELAADVRPSATEQLWIVDSYSLVLAGLLIPMSALADRWGRKRLLLLGFAVFGAASALVVLTDSPWEVVAARSLLGIGGAMIMPTTLSLLRSVFTDPAERATALGVWAGVSALGAAVGPIAGGALLEHFGWHAAFLVNVPLMLAALVAGVTILPEARAASASPWDLPSVALSVAGMVGLVWSVKHVAEEESLTDPLGLAVLVAALAALAVLVRRCLHRPEPLLDVRLFRRRPFTAGVVAALSAMFAMAAILLLLAQWLQLVEGHSPLQAGVRLLPLAGGGLVASLLASPLARLVGARAVLAGGLAAAGLGALLVPLVPGGLTYGTVAAAMTLVGAGAGSLAIGSAMIMAGTPADRAGSAAAIEETAYDLGSVLGVAVLGSVASVVYRDRLAVGTLVADGLPAGAARTAEDSLGAAVDVAGTLGAPALAERAAAAFTDALVETCLVGGAVMLAVAVVVWSTAPRGLDITQQEH
ncbi:MFS transporter [Nocardioides sp. SOB77]|uniref:MFS transporter n=1 Tax=Nocardioides oceani TaxID=3058369 RepID=A0ABT8FG64_9ACTN|nr:MFS transporter [Nocardioides oceani]MDN4173402.1 MFS transporter [Nocardioides oceani]